MEKTFMSTSEAARILGITPQRVTQLIAQGTLEAARVGRTWIVSPESVERRIRHSSSKGGRPKRGEGRSQRRFMLMNRTHEVAELVYDIDRRSFTHVGDIVDDQRTPLGVLRGRRSTWAASIDAWWRGRGMPGTRANLAGILAEAGVDVPEELVMRNLGLSLSDQYWIRPNSSGLCWEDINFFNNPFEEVSATTMAFSPVTPPAKAHPDNTSDGNLAKRWVVDEGVPTLIKEGGRLDQEPYNELVATRLHQRLLPPDEFVPYHLVGSGAHATSACPCFLSDGEEYVPALYVDRVIPDRPDLNSYQHFVACCESLGVGEVEPSLAKMIVCDDILANADRHWRNFGIVRDVESLVCRMAPVFDTGSSLWCDASLEELAKGEFSFTGKQFEQSPARQLLLVEDMSWFEASDLDGFVDEAIGILEKNPLIQDRLPYVRRSLQRRVNRIVDIREWG
ncbi:MAG: DNA-binding protein [Atopobiaceae bacterium]|nr:DNA-binding protein [Atopobiaceae bacterium]